MGCYAQLRGIRSHNIKREQEESLMTVSYTHLDVYKRQLCVGGNQSLTVPGVSSIHLDYQLAMSEIAGYLAACGKKQTALIGIKMCIRDRSKPHYARKLSLARSSCIPGESVPSS